MSPWKELAATLSLRRNLQSAGTPAEKIGSRGGGYGHFEADRQRNLEETRRAHVIWSLDLRRNQNAVTPKQLEARLAELKVEEDRLWRLCRPDLYERGIWT